MIYYGIPSYHRKDSQPTAEYLSSLGVPPERIIIATQEDEDYKSYQEKYGSIATVIYREAHSASGNRNTILEHLGIGSKVVFLDDDIRHIAILESGKLRKIDDSNELEHIVADGFRRSAEINAGIWGVYPVSNEYFMKRTISQCKLIEGTFIAVSYTGQKFNEEWKVKEDYELCCRHISEGGNTLRMNFLCAVAPHYSTKGGCHDQWGENELRAEQLLARYPYLVKRNTKRKGEIISR